MISRLFIYFVITAMIGYIYECIAMTLWSGEWDNRGFLFGPIIPIYGVGCLLGFFIFGYVFEEYTVIQVFLAGFLASAILEYPTSYIMEKMFHEKWWDYSSAPLNIQGRVSLPSSFGFGVGAVLIVYFVNVRVVPFVMEMDLTMARLISAPLAVVFIADIIYSGYCSSRHIVPRPYDRINASVGSAVDRINPEGYSISAFLREKTNFLK